MWFVVSTVVPGAAANVRFPNHNLTVGFTDATDSNGSEDYMKVERVYNSTSEFSGIFGFGWGTEQETSLLTKVDGTLQYTAYGGGATTQLTPLSRKTPLAPFTIVGAATQTRMIDSDAELRLFETDTAHPDVQFRQYVSFLKSGVLQPPETSVGELFTGESFGLVRVVRVEEGYQMFKLARPDCAGCPAFEGLFDRRLRLIRAWEHGQHGRFVVYRYDDSSDRLSEMRDYRGNTYSFTYDHYDRVVLITTGSHKTSRYKYDVSGNLIWEKDTDAHVFRYSYDFNHDLTEIVYQDKPPMRMTYPKHDGQLGSLTCSDGRHYTFVDEPGGGDTPTIDVRETRGTSILTTDRITPEGYGIYQYCVD
jgi:YD repeat-containing protein